MVNIKDIRAKNKEDLEKDLTEAYKERLFLKGQRALGNQKNIHEYKKSKKLIARILTILHEKDTKKGGENDK